MTFLSKVARDTRTIINSEGQGVIFTPPLGFPVTIKGRVGKWQMEVAESGFISVNTKKAHVTITEQDLKSAGYITRNSDDNLLTFAKHLVTFTDVSGQTKTYIIQDGESKSNETLGTIVFILGYLKPTSPPARIIYGYMDCKIYANIVSSLPTPNIQILDNGDTIPLYYEMNAGRTLTIPYLIQYPGMGVLSSFFLNGREIQDIGYDNDTGTFSNAIHGGFNNGNKIIFDARVPIFRLP